MPISHPLDEYITYSRYGDAWAGQNHNDEHNSMDGMSPRNEYVDMAHYLHIDRLGYVCNRSMTCEKRVVLHDLDEAMKGLFERMRAHTDNENEICKIEDYGSRAYRAINDVPHLHRDIHFFGYSGEGFLEELYRKLSALYAYVMMKRHEHSITERSPIQLFGYHEMVEYCMKLCREAIIHTARDNDIENPYCETGSDEYGGCNPP